MHANSVIKMHTYNYQFLRLVINSRYCLLSWHHWRIQGGSSIGDGVFSIIKTIKNSLNIVLLRRDLVRNVMALNLPLIMVNAFLLFTKLLLPSQVSQNENNNSKINIQWKNYSTY